MTSDGLKILDENIWVKFECKCGKFLAFQRDKEKVQCEKCHRVYELTRRINEHEELVFYVRGLL